MKSWKCQTIVKIAAPMVSAHASEAIGGIPRRAAGWRKGTKLMG